MQHFAGTADLDAFTRHCREHGMKITPQRIAIYRFLRASPTHPSADNVYRALKSNYPGMSFDTVNRTLTTFAGTGLIDIVESREGVRRFDANKSPHSHMHCVSCGAMFDVEDAASGGVTVSPNSLKGFRLLGSNVVFRVVCPPCNARLAEQSA